MNTLEYGHDKKIFEPLMWWGVEWYPPSFVDWNYYSQVIIPIQTPKVFYKPRFYAKIILNSLVCRIVPDFCKSSHICWLLNISGGYLWVHHCCVANVYAKVLLCPFIMLLYRIASTFAPVNAVIVHQEKHCYSSYLL